MPFGNVHIAVRSKGDHHRLPQQQLSFGFIPIAAMPAHTDRLQEFSLRADLLDRGQGRIAYPHIVARIDGHAVRLVRVADHVVADGADELVIRTELIQLCGSGGGALKYPKISFRIEGNRRDPADALGQSIWVRKCVPHGLLPLDALPFPAALALLWSEDTVGHPVSTDGRVTARRYA